MVRVLLPKHNIVNTIIEKILSEDGIQFQWTLISQHVGKSGTFT